MTHGKPNFVATKENLEATVVDVNRSLVLSQRKITRNLTHMVCLFVVQKKIRRDPKKIVGRVKILLAQWGRFSENMRVVDPFSTLILGVF